MECFDEILELQLKNDITCEENKQKYLIEFILTHSSINLNDLAELVDVHAVELSHVLAGKSFLPPKASSLLSQWFLILLED